LQLRAFKDMREGLEKAICAIHGVKTELNKLYDYVNPHVTIDGIYWRIMDNIESLDKFVEHIWSVVNEPSPPLSEY
jgi:hypothetical protein